MNLIQSKSGLFRIQETGPWEGVVKVDVVKDDSPKHHWTGAKMPLSLAYQVQAFHRWSFKETGSETVVHLFYNEDEPGWLAHVLPQVGYRGLSISVEGLTDKANAFLAQISPGWGIAGSWHNHAGISAFQSGTDHKDEEGMPGVHLTTGDCGAAKLSLHARASFMKTITDTDLADWFALTGDMAELPSGLQNGILQHLLCVPRDVAFPEVWKANIQRPAPVVVEQVWSPPVVRGKSRYTWSKDDKELESDLTSFMFMHDLAPKDVAEWLQELAFDGHTEDMIEVLVNNDATIPEAISAVERIRDKTNLLFE